MSLQTVKSDRTVEALIRRVSALESRVSQLEGEQSKEPTEKELLQERLTEVGIKYSKRDSIAKLKELLGE